MPKRLTDAEVEAFHENGYHGPLRAMSEEQAASYRASQFRALRIPLAQ